MTMEFHKDLSHLTWEQVFARQQQRVTLLPAWLDGLHIQEGDHVLDLDLDQGLSVFSSPIVLEHLALCTR